MTLVSTRAVLLRSFPFGETSRVLHFYTESLGTVAAVGRGVRTGSGKGASGLATFVEGELTLHVKATRELHTLRDFAPTRPRRTLAADVRRFGGAAALAEVVLKHAGEEANPPLFDALSGALDRLAMVPSAAVVPTLLSDAWRLVSTLGYRPVVDHCVECGAMLGETMARFDFAAGGIRCGRCAGTRGGPRLGPGARAQLGALLDGGELPMLDRPRGHLRLLSDFVTYHLSGGTSLASFEVLASLLGDIAHGGTDAAPHDAGVGGGGA